MKNKRKQFSHENQLSTAADFAIRIFELISESKLNDDNLLVISKNGKQVIFDLIECDGEYIAFGESEDNHIRIHINDITAFGCSNLICGQNVVYIDTKDDSFQIRNA